MDKLLPAGSDKIVYRGKIFKVVERPFKAGKHDIIFEIAIRSPGVRLIIVNKDKMLVTKEFRQELNTFDYRLPGGKVFDKFTEFEAHEKEDLLPYAIKAAKKESKEETGIKIKHLQHFATAKSGATVVWDLLYFIVDDFEDTNEGQNLEHGEHIAVTWKTFEEVKELCKSGKMSEDRSVGILFKFFLKYPKWYK